MFLWTSIRIVYRAMMKWSENGGMRLGAALSYYMLFSISPLLLLALYFCGAIFGEDAARGRVHEQLQNALGDEIAKAVEKLVENASEAQEATGWTPALSIALMLISALGAFLYVRSTLCMIWKLDPPHENTWLAMLWDYVLALIMVAITGLILLAALAFSLIIPIVQKKMIENEIEGETLIQWIELAASFFFLWLLFAGSYRVLSGGRIPWGYVWYGAIIASILFTIGKTLLGYYIVYSGTATSYGAAGSVVVFLVWVYYSSQVLFFGAELIQARRTRSEWMTADVPATEVPHV